MKAANQERLNVDHYFALTGTEVSDAATGQHRQIEFYGPIDKPTSATNKSWLYAKDVSDKVELHWEDEDGDEVQLTSGGYFNGAVMLADSVGAGAIQIANDTYLKAANAAGDGEVNLIKANSSDAVVIPDGSLLATSAAPTTDAMIANKKYVDDAVDAAGSLFGTWTSKSDDTSYLAETDGIVCAWTNDANTNIKGYTNSSNPPTTQWTGNFGDAAGFNHGITMPVKSGDYWKVTGADTIGWLPLGS